MPITGQLVVLTGRLDVHTVSAVRDALHAAVEQGEGRLVIDLAEIHLVDATGLGVLVGTQRRAQRAGRRIELRGTPPRLRRLLRATRLDRVLPTESDKLLATELRYPRAAGHGAPEPVSAA